MWQTLNHSLLFSYFGVGFQVETLHLLAESSATSIDKVASSIEDIADTLKMLNDSDKHLLQGDITAIKVTFRTLVAAWTRLASDQRVDLIGSPKVYQVWSGREYDVCMV